MFGVRKLLFPRRTDKDEDDASNTIFRMMLSFGTLNYCVLQSLRTTNVYHAKDKFSQWLITLVDFSYSASSGNPSGFANDSFDCLLGGKVSVFVALCMRLVPCLLILFICVLICIGKGLLRGAEGAREGLKLLVVSTFVLGNVTIPYIAGSAFRYVALVKLQDEQPYSFAVYQLFAQGVQPKVRAEDLMKCLLIVILCVVFGPVLWLFYTNTSRMPNIRPTVAKYLRSGYDQRMWELVVLLRKSLLVIITTTCPSSYAAPTGNMLMLFVIGSALVLHLKMTVSEKAPYVDPRVNQWESNVLVISALILLLTDYLLAPSFTHPSTAEVLCLFTIFLLMLSVSLVLLCLLVMESSARLERLWLGGRQRVLQLWRRLGRRGPAAQNQELATLADR